MTSVLANTSSTDIAGLGLSPSEPALDAPKTGNPVADTLAEIDTVKSPVVQGQMLHALDQHTGGPDATRAQAKAAPADAQPTGPVSATAKDTTVTYVNADGTKFTKHGNHPDRDNNPLDVQAGDFARRHGAIGKDKGFAVFPTGQMGLAAGRANIARQSKTGFDKHGTLSDCVYKNSPPIENNTEGMIRDIMKATGLNRSSKYNDLSASEKAAFVQAYARREGWHG